MPNCEMYAVRPCEVRLAHQHRLGGIFGEQACGPGRHGSGQRQRHQSQVVHAECAAHPGDLTERVEADEGRVAQRRADRGELVVQPGAAVGQARLAARTVEGDCLNFTLQSEY